MTAETWVLPALGVSYTFSETVGPVKSASTVAIVFLLKQQSCVIGYIGGAVLLALIHHLNSSPWLVTMALCASSVPGTVSGARETRVNTVFALKKLTVGCNIDHHLEKKLVRLTTPMPHCLSPPHAGLPARMSSCTSPPTLSPSFKFHPSFQSPA